MEEKWKTWTQQCSIDTCDFGWSRVQLSKKIVEPTCFRNNVSNNLVFCLDTQSGDNWCNTREKTGRQYSKFVDSSNTEDWQIWGAFDFINDQKIAFKETMNGSLNSKTLAALVNK